jgi:hypothetical protein
MSGKRSASPAFDGPSKRVCRTVHATLCRVVNDVDPEAPEVPLMAALAVQAEPQSLHDFVRDAVRNAPDMTAQELVDLMTTLGDTDWTALRSCGAPYATFAALAELADSRADFVAGLCTRDMYAPDACALLALLNPDGTEADRVVAGDLIKVVRRGVRPRCHTEWSCFFQFFRDTDAVQRIWDFAQDHPDATWQYEVHLELQRCLRDMEHEQRAVMRQREEDAAEAQRDADEAEGWCFAAQKFLAN